ncbi:MAG: BamA/TamA family outer membrane protein, partial [Bacteroidales bacterium]
FTRNLISWNYGYSWRSGDRFFYYLNPVQLNVIRLNNMDPKFYETLMDPFLKNSYRNHFDFGSGASIYYTTDASPIPQYSHFYIRWSNDIAGNLISLFNKSLSADSTGAKRIWNTPYAQYFRTDFTLGYTYKPYSTYAIATRFNFGLGYAYGNSRVLPFEKLFYAGGANSLRGWQARTVGPGSAAIDTTFSIPNQTGDIKLEFNVEYRFNMFWNFEGALFVDAGNIWTLRSDPGKESGLFRIKDFYKSMAINWGAGLRLNLDFVVLRLDMGMVAHDPFRKTWIAPSKWFQTNTYSIQFGVGYPF